MATPVFRKILSDGINDSEQRLSVLLKDGAAQKLLSKPASSSMDNAACWRLACAGHWARIYDLSM